MIPHPLTLPENARPILFCPKCRFSVPSDTPDRVVSIDPPATSTHVHPTSIHHNALPNHQNQNATSGISLTHMVIPLILTLHFNKFTCILCITSSLFS